MSNLPFEINELTRRFPHILNGWSDDLRDLWAGDWSQLVKMVDARRDA